VVKQALDARLTVVLLFEDKVKTNGEICSPTAYPKEIPTRG
jgi:hypothetical protein